MSERPELSEKNKYYISKQRYYELKHFCLQYPEWEKKAASISLLKASEIGTIKAGVAKPVENLYERKMIFEDRMKLVSDSAKETDPIIGNYILKGVTEGKSFDILRAYYKVPCCKEKYYQLYRKFFYILDKKKA